jgi:hypothetical protein
MDDGFSTTIEFSAGASSGILLYEKSLTPPGVDGGGEIDITTMLNTAYRTRSPKALITLAECTFEAAYDAAVYPQILAMVNVNQSIVITFPDATTLTFWGWLDKFIVNEHNEGEQPTATVTIVPSNVNGSGVETAPVHA